MVEENMLLKKGEVISCLEKARSISCISGILWITFENGNDILLKQGQDFEVENRQKVAIQALESSNIRLYINLNNPHNIIKSFLHKLFPTLV